MPTLDGAGPRRVNARAVRRRERNLARPTPQMLNAARAQERSYASQGQAVAKWKPAKKPYSPPSYSRSDTASGGPRQAERAQKYRESRPYYRTYRQVWSQSPGVKHASAVTKRGVDLARKGGENTPPADAKRARQLQALGNVLYDRQMRRGPDVLSNESYDKYATGLWKRAGRYYPRSKDQPKLAVTYHSPERKRAFAWVFREHPGVVHVRPETTRMFMGPKGARGPSETLLLHEWAHTRQPKSLKTSSKALTEGGAEALDQALSKRLGLDYVQSPSPDYRRWAKRVRRKGRRYVTEGQFR